MLRMNRSFYLIASGLIFLLVGVGHGLRLLYGWEAVIGGWSVPVWVSWLAVLLGFLMALTAFRMLR